MCCLIHQGPFTISKPRHHQLKLQRTKLEWNKVEFVKYAVFLEYFQSEFIEEDEANSVKWNVFIELSRFITTRSPNQCRIYHNFKMRHQKNVFYLIESNRRIIDRYEQFYEYYSMDLSVLKSKADKPKNQNAIVISEDSHSVCSSIISSAEAETHKMKDELKQTDLEYFEQKDTRDAESHESYHFFTDKSSNPGSFFSKYLRMPQIQSQTKEWIEVHESFVDWTSKFNLILLNGEHQ